jgi:hypothetical protein
MQKLWTVPLLTFVALASCSAQQSQVPRTDSSLSKEGTAPAPENRSIVLHDRAKLLIHEGETVTIIEAATITKETSKAARSNTGEPNTSLVPRPFVYSGLELNGAGYAPLAGTAGVGLRVDSLHLLANTEASYDNAHKSNDNDQPNPKGHDRGLDGSSYYRLSSGWYFGGGWRWSQLSTTNYTKSGSRPSFGGGRDYFHQACAGEDCATDFSMRLGIDYVLPGTDHTNALQGPMISFYAPSPTARGHHVYVRETLGIYVCHDTITDPTNTILTRRQIGNRSVTSFSQFTVAYRF